MSSIFEDDKLILELIRNAVEYESKFNKTGQIATDPSVNMEYRNYLTLSQKLVNDLENKLFHKEEPKTMEIEAPSGTNLGVTDLTTLGNFFEFMSKNKVSVGGQRVVYLNGESPPDTRAWLPVDAEGYIFNIENVDESGKRAATTATYYVNKDLLTKFINDLLIKTSKEDETTQKFSKTMLSGIIQKVNEIFRTNLTSDPKEIEKTIPNTEVLSSFPSSLDSTSYNKDGNIELTYGDIASDTSLVNWVKTNNISIVSGGQSINSTSDKFDFCIVMQVLHNKAKLLLRNQASTPELKSKYVAFVKQLERLAPTMTGTDGKQCNLGATTTQSVPNSATQISGQQMDPNLLRKLVDLKIFDVGAINLRNIEDWLKMYGTLSQRQGAAIISQSIQPKIQELQKYITSPVDISIPTNLFQSYERLKSWSTYPVQAIGLLVDIIKDAGAVYRDFLDSYSPQIKAYDGNTLPSGSYNQVYNQIAGSGSPWATNLSQLMTAHTIAMNNSPAGKR